MSNSKSQFLLDFLAPLMLARSLSEMATLSQIQRKSGRVGRYLDAKLELLTYLLHPSKLQLHSAEMQKEMNQKREAKNSPDIHEDKNLIATDVKVKCTF